MSDLQRVGPVFGGTGTAVPFTADITGGQRLQQAHALFFDAVMRGNCFYASMAAGAALGTALTATAVTLTIYNPLGSGIYVVLIDCTLSFSAALNAAGNSQYIHAVNAILSSAAPSA